VTLRLNQHRSVRLEWWAVVAALALLVGAIATREWLWRADQLLYDAALAVWRRPAPQDIVIVAIDDRSLAQVGRWPWRRAVHATLIDRLTEDGAKAVGLDLLLSERDTADAASDASLADAIRRSGRVVLPLVLAPPDRPELDDQLPLPEFTKAAARLGFAHVVIDADGMVRRLRLREVMTVTTCRVLPRVCLSSHRLLGPATLRRASRASRARRRKPAMRCCCPLPVRQGISNTSPTSTCFAATPRPDSSMTRLSSSARPRRVWSAATRPRFRG